MQWKNIADALSEMFDWHGLSSSDIMLIEHNCGSVRLVTHDGTEYSIDMMETEK